MTKRAYKLAGIVLALCLIFGVFAGCKASEPAAEPTKAASEEKATEAPQATAQEEEAAEPEGPSYLKDTSPITFTAIMHPQLAQNNWGDDEVSRYITERTGVTLDITFQSTWDDQQLSTLLASGSKLPDFIVAGYGSTASNAMQEQGFVLPLNELAEQYAPDFFDWLPEDMDKIYGSEDGNLYCVGDMFGDFSRKSELGVTSYVDTGVAVQTALLEGVGSPSVDTLEDFKQACLAVMGANPELGNPILLEQAGNPIDKRGIAQIVNRLYGGQDVISIADDDTVHLNFRDESYINALKYIGDLYRSDIIPVESFTMTNEQRLQALANNDVFAYFGFYYNLGQHLEAGFTEETPYWSIEPPVADGISRDDITLPDQYAGIGGWHGVHISTDCENPERAIQYITFLLSDEGQVLQRLGVEGTGYEYDAEGKMVFGDRRKELAVVGPDKIATELGIDNWNWCWLEQFYIIMVGEELNAKELPALSHYYNMYAKYAGNERLNLLTANIKDTDMQVLRTKIDELWKTAYAKIVLSESEEKLMEEYNSFLEQAEKLGLSSLEAYYTEQYKAHKAKLAD